MRFLLTLPAVLLMSLLYAQDPCATKEARDLWFRQHPELKAAYDQRRNYLAEQDKAAHPGKFPGPASTQATINYTIPVVFHILHTGGPENISDAQVHDAIRIINEDFSATNPDTNNVVHAFKNLIGNTQFEFRLATRDPQGKCTNGIIRHWDANTNWVMVNFNDYKYTWNPSRYMNVYVVKTISGGNAAGYTFLPGSGVPTSADCIVMLSHYVGSTGTGIPALSRVLTHEAGHWFDLEHTWGGNNNAGVACGDDGVGDTPVTTGYKSCNLNGANTCDPNIEENIQNYMDYAYCNRMFTVGQSFRMQQCVSSFMNGRNNLSVPSNLAFTGITSPGTGCMTGLELGALPSATVCAGMPLSVYGYTSNAAPTGMSWNAPAGAVVATPLSNSTTIVFPVPGDHIVSCAATTSAGTVTQTLSVKVLKGAASLITTDEESFENGALPADWNITGSVSNAAWNWQLFGAAGKTGMHSMMIAGESVPANVQSILQTPGYDFRGNPGARFTFYYAYAKRKPESNDLFKVQATKNCGSSWSDIWIPSMSTIAKNTGGTTTAVFVPFQEWAKYDLTAHPAFAPFLKESNVQIRFIFEEDREGSGYGNRFYLDDINFQAAATSTASVSELSRALALSVYPNPSDDAFSVSFNITSAAHVACNVTNVSGQTVFEKSPQQLPAGEHTITLGSGLAPGIYLLNLQIDGVGVCRKIVKH